jgi:hypothetical protein
VRDIFAGYQRYFEDALREATVDLGRPVDVAAAGEALVAYFQGALLLAKTQNDPDVIDRLAGRALGLVGLDEASTLAQEGRTDW